MNPRFPDRPSLPIPALHRIFRVAGVVPGAGELAPVLLQWELQQ